MEFDDREGDSALTLSFTWEESSSGQKRVLRLLSEIDLLCRELLELFVEFDDQEVERYSSRL